MGLGKKFIYDDFVCLQRFLALHDFQPSGKSVVFFQIDTEDQSEIRGVELRQNRDRGSNTRHFQQLVHQFDRERGSGKGIKHG